MTTLLCQKLVTKLSQDIRALNNERVHIGCISPYILMYNAPTGTFTFTLKKSSVTVFSKTFTSAGIKTSLATTNNYAHVFYPLIPSNPVAIEAGDYTMELTASGYTASESSYIAWMQQHEDIQNEMSYVPINDMGNSLAYRIKEYREGIRW